MSAGGSLSRLGFDPQRLRYSLRTAAAACLALLVAWLLGLEHPQWSAMTVFAASQPARNLLVEKSLFRAAGTLVGTGLGVALMLGSGGDSLTVVVALAGWIGLCAWAGNLLRGFVAYGTLLAGYSASMVVLLDIRHPENILWLGADRLLTVLTGVATALVVELLLSPRQADDVAARTRDATACLLCLLAQRPAEDDRERRLLRDLAALDEALDPHGAGSLRSRRSARTLRGVISGLVPVLVWLRAEDRAPTEPGAEAALVRAAEALEAGAPPREVAGLLATVADRASAHPDLQGMILRLGEAVRARAGVVDGETRGPWPDHMVLLHRDWVGARQAALRAVGIMLLLGGVWVVTGWSAGPLLLLGTSVMVTLFSTWENPALIMRDVLIGQAFGALAALACRWLVWPLATGELQLVLMLMPFVLAGALPMAHRRTMLGATDYCMALLLLSSPSFPLTGDPAESVSRALAVVAAPFVTLIAFRLVFPADARRRLSMLAGMMVREIQDLASSRHVAGREALWRARLHHRLLRLVRLSQRAGERGALSEEGGFAMFTVGLTVLRLRELEAADGLPRGLARAMGLALARAQGIGHEPRRAARALDRVAGRLDRAGRSEADLVRRASREIEANLAFFTFSEHARLGG